MTRRTVVWIPSAEKDLADIWLASSLRNKVTAAVDAIDLAHAQDAEAVGNPLAERCLHSMSHPCGCSSRFSIRIAWSAC